MNARTVKILKNLTTWTEDFVTALPLRVERYREVLHSICNGSDANYASFWAFVAQNRSMQQSFDSFAFTIRIRNGTMEVFAAV